MPIQLTPEQTKQLSDLDKVIKDLTAELGRFERAGVDVTEMRKALETANVTRKSILKEFGATLSTVSR